MLDIFLIYFNYTYWLTKVWDMAGLPMIYWLWFLANTKENAITRTLIDTGL